MRQPEPSRIGTAAGWLGRMALLLGGTALAVRTGLPLAKSADTESVNADTQPWKGGLDDNQTGRGKPETPPSREAVHEGHETKDLDARTLAKLVVGLGTAVLIVIFGIVGFRKLVTGVTDRDRPALTAQQTTPINPPAPTLQANPVEELAQLRSRENQLLVGYAWRDGAHTEARIPIDRAMKLIVGHPLDVAP